MKKITFILMTLLFSFSCFVKVDNKPKTEGRVQMTITWPEKEAVSDIQRQLHPDTNEIKVILINKATNDEFYGETIKDPAKTSQEIIIESVPIGSYTLIIESYNLAGELLARIYDTLSVTEDDDVTTYEGSFGKPDNLNATPISPINGGIVISNLVLSWESVKSNYTSTDPVLDNIDYKVYIGLSSAFAEEDLLSTIRNSTEQGISLYITQEEIVTDMIMESGNTYYWQVVPYNNEGETKGEVWNFVYNENSNLLNEFPIDPVYPTDGTDVSSLDFKSIGSLGGTADSVTYTIYLSTSNLFDTGEEKTFTERSVETGVAISLDLSTIENYFQTGITYYWKVEANNGYDITVSPTWNFVYNAGSLLTDFETEPIAPANNANISQLANLQFTSIASAGGEADNVDYTVTVSTASTFDTGTEQIFAGNSTTSGITVTIDTAALADYLVYETSYYWKVEANNGYDTKTSAIWAFTYSMGTTLVEFEIDPVTPTTETDPTDKLEFTSIGSTDGSADTVDYIITVSTVNTFDTGTEQTLTETSTQGGEVISLDTSIITNYFETGRRYYWKVDADNGYDITTSPTWTFIYNEDKLLTDLPTTPVYPVDGTDITGTLGRLQFIAIASNGGTADNVDYTVTVSTASTFDTGNEVTLTGSSTAGGETVTIDTSSLASYLVYEGRYYWKVEASNGYDTKTSSTWSFTYNVNSVLLTDFATSPVYPVDGTDITGTLNSLQFTSIASNGGTADNVNYTVTISTASTFDTGNEVTLTGSSTAGGETVTIDTSSLSSYLVYEGRYYWKVEASNGYDTKTSTIWSFTYNVNSVLLTDFATSPTYPTNGTDIAGTLNSLQFTSIASNGGTADNVNYTVTVSTASTFDTGNEVTLTGSSTSGEETVTIDVSNLSNYLVYEGSYYWKVEASNGYDTKTSTIWSFTYNVNSVLLTDFVTSPVYPVDGTDITGTLNSLQFTSIASNGGTADNVNYTVTVSTASTFDTGNEVTLTGSSTSGEETVTIDTSSLASYLVYEGSYYWKVEASNGYDSKTSSTWSFTYNVNSVLLTDFATTPVYPVMDGDVEYFSDGHNFEFTSIGSAGEVADTVDYTITVSTASTFDTGTEVTLTGSSTSGGTTVSIDPYSIINYFKYGGRYYWKVEASNGYDTKTSDTWTFTFNIGYLLIDFDNLPLYPLHKSMVVIEDYLNYMKFTAIESVGGLADTVSYTLIVSTSSTFDTGTEQTIVIDDFSSSTEVIVDTSSISPYFKGNTVYYWKVEGTNGYDTKVSPIWQFSFNSQ